MEGGRGRTGWGHYTPIRLVHPSIWWWSVHARVHYYVVVVVVGHQLLVVGPLVIYL